MDGDAATAGYFAARKESWLYHGKFASPVLLVAVAAVLPESAAITVTQTHRLAGHSSVFVALALVLYAFINRNRGGSSKARAAKAKIAPVYCLVALYLTAMTLGGTALAHVRADVETSRTFYGVLSVRPQNMDDPTLAKYSMLHGRVFHGFQFRAEAERRTPTSYYGPSSGVGVAVRQATLSLASRGQAGLRIGVVGLGAGTVAAYGRAADHLRFYEINPDDIRIASDPRFFTFLSDSAAQIEVIPGDGRLSLERELAEHGSQDFDVLVIDAFSGDAIPVHLLTLEAFEIYRRSLKTSSEFWRST